MLAQLPWIPFVAPLVAFMLLGSLEATRSSGSTFFGLIRYEYYPVVYTAKIAIVVLVLAWVWPAYRVFPFKVSPLAVLVGAVGVVLWVVIVDLRLEQYLPLEWLTGTGERRRVRPKKVY